MLTSTTYTLQHYDSFFKVVNFVRVPNNVTTKRTVLSILSHLWDAFIVWVSDDKVYGYLTTKSGPRNGITSKSGDKW